MRLEISSSNRKLSESKLARSVEITESICGFCVVHGNIIDFTKFSLKDRLSPDGT